MKYLISTLCVVLAACGGSQEDNRERAVSCTQNTNSGTTTVYCNEVDPAVASGRVPDPNDYSAYQGTVR